MTRKQFREFAFVNDISFFYHNREYYILQGGNSCICGSYDGEKEEVFDNYPSVMENIDDMLEHWMIDGKTLGDLIAEIEFHGN